MSQSEHADWPMPKQGEFCWTEIASNDSATCKAFYTNVFGWKFQDTKPGSEGFEYNEFSDSSGPGPVGGLYQIDPKFFGGHAPPPHFMIYVAVDNVDESAEKAVSLGATIATGPMDIPNVGRFAVVKDPTGAALAIFTMLTGGVTE
jgi:predicted enzyme related to lactoylglutathione lyase